MSGKDDVDSTKRNYGGPYTSHHPIPTIQKYREEKKARQDHLGDSAGLGHTAEGEEDFRHEAEDAIDASREQKTSGLDQEQGQDDVEQDDEEDEKHTVEDTSEATASAQDPKQRRKQMKKRGDEKAEREVTDPVTHLPVEIHDFTGKDLKEAPENEAPAGSESRSTTGLPAQLKDTKKLRGDHSEMQEAHYALQAQFPPPKFESVRAELSHIVGRGIAVGLTGVVIVCSLTYISIALVGERKALSNWAQLGLVALCFGVSCAIILGVKTWTTNKINHAWDDEVWAAKKREAKEFEDAHNSETTQWLNSLLASIWPLVNPDLFTSVADTLEDVMQASLPKMVRMVSVDDIGQGSESIRILGVRWLPTGAAAKTVSKDGQLKSGKDAAQSDRAVPGEGEVQQDAETDDNENDDKGKSEKETQGQEEDDQNVAEGMEAESGDFVNIEIAFSYRRRAVGKGMHSRAKNAHLYLAFYLYAGIKFPVWVELHGLVGIMRLRLQLTPDPPFFSLCTMTFLGQPKVDLSCVPLSKHGLNIMDLPLISNFVQSAVDAGLSTLVAPRSMTVDLKEMLVGDDFKKDTTARGVLVVRIKRGFDFKEGDTGIGIVKDGSADPYVSVGWAKFGKPVWTTRVILSEMQPSWDETAFILITPEELNVDERLRVQLWDSDRTTADDDLGRIEVDIKELMKDSRSNGKMWEREDGFKSLKKGEDMPGKLCWEVGYFSKTRILDSQLAKQSEDPDIQSVEQLKKKVYEESEKKLREADKDESAEIEQQKQQDLKARQDELLIHSPPPDKYPTGILSIQIHQITGLELEAINKNRASKKDNASDEVEEGDDLPSSYCTIILNHQKIFRTRTKPKNGKPFFNAGTERVVRDWRNTEVHIAVRDSRVHEDDPLLGMVYLPLGKLLSRRSQFSESFPLSGGIGFGRARISVVFRSIQLQAPKALLGWEFGTLEIDPEIRASDDLPEEFRNLRLKFRTSIGRGKAHSDGHGLWKPKGEKPLRIAVKKRYSSALVIEFRSDRALKNSTSAFAVLWLKDVVDNEQQTLKLSVWKGSDGLKRAETCCLEKYGDEVGHIELKLTFWSGLSGYHAKLASKDTNLEDVMEVLDAANDNDEMDFNFDGDDGTESDTSSSDDDQHTPTSTDTENLSESGKRGPIDAVKDYKNNRKQLHRRNRGLMQWKGARTAKWTESKIKDGGNAISSLFQHHERDSGIETEV